MPNESGGIYAIAKTQKDDVCGIGIDFIISRSQSSDSISAADRSKLAAENFWGIVVGIIANYIQIHRLDLLMLRSGRATLLYRAEMESKS